jgi:hypothetical protein
MSGVRAASRCAAAAQPVQPSRVRCREIGQADIGEVADLLTRGFQTPLWKQLLVRWKRSPDREFWLRAFERLSAHPTAPGFPQYGFLLESGGSAVAAVLLIASVVDVDGDARVRCNISSWYAEPEFRCYAPMLAARILRDKRVTYLNITPSKRTFGILRAQGFEQYCAGRFVAIPARPRRFDHEQADVVPVQARIGNALSAGESALLATHADYGCISLVCRAESSEHPFVFLPLRRGPLRFAHLAYCRHPEDFMRFSGPLGRFLLRRGIPLVVIDANGPCDGVLGKYFAKDPKYFKGPARPRLGDIAYSERVMFGF